MPEKRIMGFNCAAPFRERLAGGPDLGRILTPGFNCAAPFRERLGDLPTPVVAGQSWLQLCRPLSGAVSRYHRAGCGNLDSFNCAAPFRERLGALAEGLDATPNDPLQLCRPLSGAVSLPKPLGLP